MTNHDRHNNNISRRDFLGRLTLGASAIAGLTVAGCRRHGDTKATVAATGTTTPGEMTYRTSPTSGDRVSLLGYGCMRWPQKYNPADGTTDIDQEAVNRLVDHAIAHGVNYFDTAPPYLKGKSEAATGEALSRHPRDSYYLATKLSTHPDNPQLRTLAGARAMFENSLRQLRTDYIDYYLIHCVGLGHPVMEQTARLHPDDPDGYRIMQERLIDNGVLDFLVEERRAGRIRNLGFSYHGDVAVFDYLLSQHDKYKWDFVQIELNYLDWEYANEINPRNTDAKYLYAELKKRGIPAVIMEPLLGGRLANIPQYMVTEMKKRAPESSVASWAFRYAGTPDGVLTVLSGMTYMEHLKDNLISYCPLKPVSADESKFLHDIAGQIVNMETIPCNDCKYCMPCPYGVDIPGIFVHYNKCKNEGRLPNNIKDKNYDRLRREYLIGLDRSVPRLRQASHCIGCGQCEPHCPQGIHIPRELHIIDQYAERLKQEKML